MEKNFKNRLWNFLEWLSVAYYSSHLLLPPYTFFLLLFLLFFTRYWPLVLISITWMIIDIKTPFKGGRQYRLIKNFFVWYFVHDYFPLKLIKTAKLEPNKNYLFLNHPHGFFCASTFLNFSTKCSKVEKLFPGLKFHIATLNFNFFIPILREYAMSMGLVPVAFSSLKYLLNRSDGGNAVNLVVGGASEIAYTKSGDYRIILKKRKGFIKVALITGCSLVPVFCFGENDLYRVVVPSCGSILFPLHQWFQKVTGGVPLGACLGCSWFFPLIPKRMPLTTVVGKSIDLPKISDPTEEEIEHYHHLYTDELIKLFNEHKHKYADDVTQLIIVE